MKKVINLVISICIMFSIVSNSSLQLVHASTTESVYEGIKYCGGIAWSVAKYAGHKALESSKGAIVGGACTTLGSLAIMVGMEELEYSSIVKIFMCTFCFGLSIGGSVGGAVYGLTK